ncbi:TetR/AcrR family transcriptional regulator [Clostridium ganghwense]|uniref:Helix-turn-helix domain containing protein n=1 Tax=Clostridium ganghwense TaxID=312089 RepID=A0ABT4CSP2_9CLOT|nr:helix-turn-helix domain containing protein [Clostridium ganghwense]
MPKIIEDIETKILNAAYELFNEGGWESIDMRKIAQKAGVGVGTLYNYYKNKNQLFISVLKLSWQDTVCKLEKAMKIPNEPVEKVNLFIEIVHQDLNIRKGIDRHLRNTTSQREFEMMIDIRKEFFGRLTAMMQDIISKIKEKHGLKISEDMEDRFSEAFVILTAIEHFRYQDEKEKNIKFLNELFKIIYM